MNHLNYSKIDRYILIGTSICCRKHFELLLAEGMDADIDLEIEKMDKPSGVTAFLWLPTFDFTAPSQAQLYTGAHFIDNLIKHRMKCYVHCNAGQGRAPTLVAAYYIMRMKLTPKAVIKFLQSKRKQVSPNKKQIMALNKFYKYLYKKSPK
ncbi:MAG: dual specificity protein phosphatase family protein [bacterium]|nr:dual specificity protein phosphatase family protein [bacterium]